MKRKTIYHNYNGFTLYENGENDWVGWQVSHAYHPEYSDHTMYHNYVWMNNPQDLITHFEELIEKENNHENLHRKYQIC